MATCRLLTLWSKLKNHSIPITLFLPPRTCSSFMLGRFPDYTPKSDLPVNDNSGVSLLFLFTGYTVAGTVPDSHRIPFSCNAADADRCITKTRAKLVAVL